MKCRVGSLLLLAVAMASLVAATLAAADDKDRADKNTHVGKFVSAKGEKEFAMEGKGGKEHTHTMAAGAKVYGPDGKQCHLKDLTKGQLIRVTTKEGDVTVATRVEAIGRKRE